MGRGFLRAAGVSSTPHLGRWVRFRSDGGCHPPLSGSREEAQGGSSSHRWRGTGGGCQDRSVWAPARCLRGSLSSLGTLETCDAPSTWSSRMDKERCLLSRMPCVKPGGRASLSSLSVQSPRCTVLEGIPFPEVFAARSACSGVICWERPGGSTCGTGTRSSACRLCDAFDILFLMSRCPCGERFSLFLFSKIYSFFNGYSSLRQRARG